MQTEKNILSVGSLALDTLETPRGNRNKILGGSSTYFAIATSLFAPISLVGVVGDDFPQTAWDLFHSKNVDTQNVQRESGKTFQWGGKYSNNYSARDTLFTELGVFETFSPQIKNEYRNYDILFLGNIHPSLQLKVLEQMNSPHIVVTDTMNLWIDLDKSGLMDVVSKTNIFLLNDEEAEQLTGYSNIQDAGNYLLDQGPTVVVIKQGGNGSLVFQNTTQTHIPVVPNIDVFDPTGAGDSFAGGLVGCIANQEKIDIVEAVITGSAVASFTVSDFGIDGLLKANLEMIEQRKNQIRNQI
jgi:sugar/nucleoside kinase (ribokinase family)